MRRNHCPETGIYVDRPVIAPVQSQHRPDSRPHSARGWQRRVAGQSIEVRVGRDGDHRPAASLGLARRAPDQGKAVHERIPVRRIPARTLIRAARCDPNLGCRLVQVADTVVGHFGVLPGFWHPVRMVCVGRSRGRRRGTSRWRRGQRSRRSRGRWCGPTRLGWVQGRPVWMRLQER